MPVPIPTRVDMSGRLGTQSRSRGTRPVGYAPQFGPLLLAKNHSHPCARDWTLFPVCRGPCGAAQSRSPLRRNYPSARRPPVGACICLPSSALPPRRVWPKWHGRLKVWSS